MITSKSTLKTPFLSVVSTSLKPGTCSDVTVTVTPSIGLPSGSRTWPISRPLRIAKADPEAIRMTTRIHATMRIFVCIRSPLFVFEYR